MEINLTEQTTTENGHSSPYNRKKQSMLESELHEAALKNNWDAAEKLFRNNPTLLKTPITKAGEIALHIAALEGHTNFVSKLLDIMEISDLAHLNAKGCTALCFAATAGHTEIARKMVEKNPSLPTVKGENGVRPLYMAALQGYAETANFLFLDSHIGTWTEQERIKLLTSAIDSELYDLSIDIVEKDNSLALAENEDGWTPFQLLARNKLPSSCNNRQGFWDKIITTVPHKKKSRSIHDTSSARPRASGDPYALFECLWEAAESYNGEDVESAEAIDASTFFFIAAESGNSDLLMKVLKKDHNLLYKLNHEGHSIFHIAVLHRHETIFNLMYEFSGTRDLMAEYIDDDRNNILHLAGKNPPRIHHLNTIPALQMQQEVLWFKEVEKLVQPSFGYQKNNEGQTPHELFLSDHKKLTKEGEKFMKQIAKSCMLVTILIATVVFTTAFTVPGGYDNATGYPILEHKGTYVVFQVSEAAATLCSLTSMLMFLSILTSRYTAEDFLETLPFWLVAGLAALFFSIVAMMVAFCTCLLFFEHQKVSVTLLLVFFASVPTMFLVLKYPLLLTILSGIYSSKSLFRPTNR